jgi:hypothetical protein
MSLLRRLQVRCEFPNLNRKQALDNKILDVLILYLRLILLLSRRPKLQLNLTKTLAQRRQALWKMQNRIQVQESAFLTAIPSRTSKSTTRCRALTLKIILRCLR